MSNIHSNGSIVHKIERKGKATFALGDGAPFTIDVIATHSDWLQLDRSHRNEAGEVPQDKMHALEATAWDFAKSISKTEDITLAEALEFLATLADLADELSAFFVRKSRTQPSSQGSTELTFSE